MALPAQRNVGSDSGAAVSDAPGTEIEGWVERDDGTLLVDARPFDPARFRLGATVRGRVVNTSDRGVVLDLGDCDGRIMVDRLPAERPPGSYQLGEEVDARVIDVQRRDRWFKLAVAPFDPRGLQAGDVLEAKVTRTTPHAAFLDVGGLVGFVAEEEFGPHAPAVGEIVRAWVVHFDYHRESVVCSLRPFDVTGLSIGRETAATIVRAGPNQLTVDLPGPLRAMVLERGLPPHLIGSAERYLRTGQRITVVVTEINPRTRWIECAYRPETYSFGPEDVGWSPFSGLVERSEE